MIDYKPGMVFVDNMKLVRLVLNEISDRHYQSTNTRGVTETSSKYLSFVSLEDGTERFHDARIIDTFLEDGRWTLEETC